MNKAAVSLTLGIAVAGLAATVIIAKIQVNQYIWYGWVLTNPWLVPILFAIAGVLLFACLREWNAFRRIVWHVLEQIVPRPSVIGIKHEHEPGGLRVLHTIGFDYLLKSYLRVSPLDRGWTKAYGEGTPEFGTDPEIPGSLSLKVSGDQFAMDYEVPQHAKPSNQISFTAKFIRDAFLYAEVEVIDKSHQRQETWWLAHVIGQKAPEKLTQWTEWKFYLSPLDHTFNISLADEVEVAFGKEGKVLAELKRIRIRGDLSISAIKVGTHVQASALMGNAPSLLH
jgi:hypothetical protein